MSDAGRPEFREFGTRTDASDALAQALETDLAEAVQDRGEAALVVSGGTSPATMFHALRKKVLPWHKVSVIPSDERNVALEHPDRNESMIRRELLAENAADAHLLSLLPAGDIPDRFDAVVLGMGDDGHTASLFPDSPDLHRALDSQAQLEQLEVPRLGASRISLTPCALLSSRKIYLLFFGREKRRVYEAALQENDINRFPVRIVLGQHRVPVAVYWAP
ncbi:MAG: 6-phosphogluconolactonase [Xanthomonadales bacterium]|jgi:6-phosphogluconolactonase|nr:6-phosphogluconolactonase [Xanthomonadales bacterium]